MYSRMDKYHGQKVQRFSIRKYSFGAASVAVAAYMMFGGAATVHAEAPSTTTVTNEQVNPDAGNQADSSKPQASTYTATPTVEAQTAEQPAAPAPAAPAPATPAPEAAPAETPKAAEAPTETPKADTSKLEAAIARLEAALEKTASTEKTASAIESAKAELANAKAVVANEAATKEEVAKATSADSPLSSFFSSFTADAVVPSLSTVFPSVSAVDGANSSLFSGSMEASFLVVAGVEVISCSFVDSAETFSAWVVSIGAEFA